MWEDLLLFVAVGFAAQMVDGAIGMAYGVISTSVMLSLGIPPATASACVHAAETFTTAVSGASHWRFGNVDRKLLLRLALPGAIGGAIGAYVLTNLDGDKVKPFISAYLLLIGLVHRLEGAHQARLGRYASHRASRRSASSAACSIPSAAAAGVRSSPRRCIGQGTTPRYAIGSVNLAEFFVTLTISATFVATIGLELWPIITGLIIGGVIAAPFAAYATKVLPDKVLMILVGCVVAILSLRTIVAALT